MSQFMGGADTAPQTVQESQVKWHVKHNRSIISNDTEWYTIILTKTIEVSSVEC